MSSKLRVKKKIMSTYVFCMFQLSSFAQNIYIFTLRFYFHNKFFYVSLFNDRIKHRIQTYILTTMERKKKLSTKINTIDIIRYANLIDLDWKILENSTYKLAASTHNLFRIKAWSNNRFYAVIESSIQDEEWTKIQFQLFCFSRAHRSLSHSVSL